MLTLGLPSKGRMKEEAEAFFKRIGTPVHTTDPRDYVGVLRGIDNVRVLFLPAAEIASRLHTANALDLGLTGQDLLVEHEGNTPMPLHTLAAPNFGHGRLVVAVSNSWLDVDTMRDLDDVAYELRQTQGRRLRVSTKYPRATLRFFDACGLSDYRLVESRGATEAAVNDGSTDIITDLTSTGATLEANQLKILRDGIMMQTQAVLSVNLANINAHEADKLAPLLQLSAFITANEVAPTLRLLRGGLADAAPEVAHQVLQNAGARDIMLAQGGFSCTIDTGAVYGTVQALQKLGAGSISTVPLDQLFPKRDKRRASLLGALAEAAG